MVTIKIIEADQSSQLLIAQVKTKVTDEIITQLETSIDIQAVIESLINSIQ